MKKSTLLIGVAVLMLMYSCKSDLRSVDFTPEGGFTDGIEGPATDHLGNIYAVNYQQQGTIGKVTPDGECSLFLNLPNGSIGNGIRFGDKDQMFVADYINHNVLEVNLSSKSIEVFAHQPSANQPNDLAISPNRTIYASDPNWSEETGQLWKVTRENGFELLEDNMGTTNGIEVSPNGKKLYVNESIQRKIWEYDILDNGSVANKKLFHSFDDFGLDGMRCDKKGNLYVCRFGKGTVAILSAGAVLLDDINLTGQKPTNITFSPDYKKCYVTLADRGCIEMVEL